MSHHKQHIRLAAALLALPLIAGLGARLVQAGVQALLGPVAAGAGGLVAVLTGGATVAAGVVLVWLALGATVAVAEVVTTRRGRPVPWLADLAHASTGVRLRQVVAAALGAGVVCTSALPAHAAGPAAPALLAAAVVDPGWAPFTADVDDRGAADGFTPPPPPRTVRTAPADPGPVIGAPRTQLAVDDEVVVRRGDTLWHIAERHLPAGASAAEIAAEWPRWYAANESAIGADPDLLLPGTRLVAPGAGS